MMSGKPRWEWDDAAAAARELCRALKPVTTRLCIAGSLRRRSPLVGDVEILYIPATEARKVDLFHVEPVDLAAEELELMVRQGILAKRLSVTGSASWGPKNKLAVHVASGIPVDLFAASENNWWNYLVCRTGPAALNKRIATLAQKKGWKWHPYGEGFTGPAGQAVAVTCEEEVFEFVGLPFMRPADRYTLCRGGSHARQ
jgi:DNA polymerase/3'-5' exonuclease PolX